MSANFIDLSGGRFSSHPTLERSRFGLPRWPAVLGAATVFLLGAAILSREAVPPSPGEPPTAEFVVPPGYAVTVAESGAAPGALAAIPAIAPIERVRADTAARIVDQRAAPAPIRIARAERVSPARPRAGARRGGGEAVTTAPAASGVEGLF